MFELKDEIKLELKLEYDVLQKFHAANTLNHNDFLSGFTQFLNSYFVLVKSKNQLNLGTQKYIFMIEIHEKLYFKLTRKQWNKILSSIFISKILKNI